jgi:hypothetical protein
MTNVLITRIQIISALMAILGIVVISATLASAAHAGNQIRLSGHVTPKIEVTIPDEGGRNGTFDTGESPTIISSSPTRSPHSLSLVPIADYSDRRPAAQVDPSVESRLEADSHIEGLTETARLSIKALPHANSRTYRVIVRAP